MIRFTKDKLRRWLEALLHIHDTPQRTAAAYALGVFFGFSPLLGLHTILGIVLGFALNLNRVAVLLGVYSNLPWLLAPYYTLATLAGARLLGRELPPGFGARLAAIFGEPTGENLRHLFAFLRPLLWPFTVGSTIGAVLLAALAYRVALTFVLAHRRRVAKRHAENHHLPPGSGAPD